MATRVTTHVSLLARLESRAAATCAKILDLCLGSDAIAAELQDKFHEAVSDVKRVRITALDERRGAFFVDGDLLILNEEPIAKLLAYVLADVEGRAERHSECMLPDEVPELLERVFVDYILHELRHRTQGLGDHGTVDALKAVAGAKSMADMDVFADRDAAFASASINAEGGSREEFLSSFREALFYSSAYFFKVFPPTPDRPDKLERAIAVLLMAARLAAQDLERPVKESADFPLDAPIVVSLSTPQNQLAIFKAEPSKRLLGVANDADGVGDLVADIKLGDFDSALERSVGLMGKLNLLR